MIISHLRNAINGTKDIHTVIERSDKNSTHEHYTNSNINEMSANTESNDEPDIARMKYFKLSKNLKYLFIYDSILFYKSTCSFVVHLTVR